MHPLLFHLGPIPIHTYGVLVAGAILLGLWLGKQQAARMGLDAERVWNAGIYMILGGLAGSKIWYILENHDYYFANPGQILSLNTFQAAGVFYGGFLAALATGVLYLRHSGLSYLALLDAYAAPVALGHGLGRLGCFSAGCCYGKPTMAAWGVTFTSDYASRITGVPLGVPLHPTQLYEAGAEFITFAFLLWLGRRQRFQGQLFAAYMIGYGFIRGINEVFRGDPGRTPLWGDSGTLMQVVSLGFVVLGVVVWLRNMRTPLTAPRVAGS
jgi:phosphatidylglycerol:prolipoprotein diacylglycerol transferase